MPEKNKLSGHKQNGKVGHWRPCFIDPVTALRLWYRLKKAGVPSKVSYRGVAIGPCEEKLWRIGVDIVNEMLGSLRSG